MKTIEKIRQKIEELYEGEAPAHDQQCEFEDGYFTGIATISKFLDTLEEKSEKPTNLDDLLDDYFEKLVVPEHQIIFEDTYRKIATDFYRMGQGSSEKPNNHEGLDDAAKNYALNTAEDSEQYSARYLGYKDGAKWRKEQDDKELSEKIAAAYQLGVKDKEQKPVEKPKWDDSDMREDESELQTRFAFYTYKDDPTVLYLSNVFVEEASRNHGFGTRILKAAEKVAETIGASSICLKVKQNTSANEWYRKRGYGYVAFEDGYDWLQKNLEYMKPVDRSQGRTFEMDFDGYHSIELTLDKYVLQGIGICPHDKVIVQIRKKEE